MASAQPLICKMCGNIWFPRVRKPMRCPDPDCQSRHWERGLDNPTVEDLQETYERLINRSILLQNEIRKLDEQLSEAVKKRETREEEMRRRYEGTKAQQLADETEAELKTPEE